MMEHFYQDIEGCFTWPQFYSDLAKELAAKKRPTRGIELGNMFGQSLAYLGVELLNIGADCIVDGVDQWDRARNNLSPLIGKTIGKLLVMYSWEASEYYEDKSLDFVFIDAGHDYKSVKRDIEAWLPKITPGGLISGHDFASGPKYEGLKKAVLEAFPAPQVHTGIEYKGRYYPVWFQRL